MLTHTSGTTPMNKSLKATVGTIVSLGVVALALLLEQLIQVAYSSSPIMTLCLASFIGTWVVIRGFIEIADVL